MTPTTIPYGFSTEVALPFTEALARTRAALATQGFGVLCEIDVAATLHQKLGVAMPAYTILGACSPPFAHRALTADPDIGLLLPCNVVVRETDAADRCIVAAIDPEKQLQLADGEALRAIAREVGARLWEVLIAVGQDAEARPGRVTEVAQGAR